MDNRLKIYIVAVSLFVSLKVLAQDPGFSQYYATPFYVNPAFAGDKQSLNASLNNRQFNNTQIANYTLSQFTLLVPFKADFLYDKRTKINHTSGFATSVYREATGQNGELDSYGMFFSAAHSIQLQREHFLSLGLQAGYVYKIQGDNFMWGSQYSEDFGYDPTITPSVDGLINLNSHFPTFGAGLEYFYNSGVAEDYFKKYDFDAYAGIAVFNVNRPNQSFFKENEAHLPMSFKANAGMKYHANKRFALFPTFLWIQQNKINQINFGVYANIRTVKTEKKNAKVPNVIIGGWYRLHDSYIATFGLTMFNFKAAVSYDFNATNFNLNNKGKGATEITVKITIPSNKKEERYSRGLLYPSF